MYQLKYLDEIRPMDEIGNLDSLQKVDSKELSLGKTLVENLTTEKFDPGQYSDTYAKELEKLIEAKSNGHQVVSKEEAEEPEETTDILEALKASLKVKGKASTSSTAAKAKGKMSMAVTKQVVWNRRLYTQEKSSKDYLRQYEYTGEALSSKHQDCISCGHRTEYKIWLLL